MAVTLVVRLSFRTYLLGLTFISALLFFSLAMLSHYVSQKRLLLENTQSTNMMYANKLANILSIYLTDAQQVLAYSALQLTDTFAEATNTAAEAHRLLTQNRYFNSIVMVDSTATIVANAPTQLQLIDKKLQTAGARQSLLEKRPLVSPPFYSAAGNYIISISTPVYSGAGAYLGFISGTLYLKKDSILSELLSQHYAPDYLNIVITDDTGIILYHKDPTLIGKSPHALNTPPHATVGLSEVSTTPNRWRISVSRDYAKLHAELRQHVLSGLQYFIIASIVLAITIWWLGSWLTKPLLQLVKFSSNIGLNEYKHAFSQIQSPVTEIQQLKRALFRSRGAVHHKLEELNRVSETDSLTELANKRGLMSYKINLLCAPSARAIIAFDIDHFKQVNDVFGHAKGDEVLQKLSQLLKKYCPSNDFLCRNGGEEFLIISELSLTNAYRLADEIRGAVADCDFGLNRKLTISSGVNYWQPMASSFEQAISEADQALYQAKATGRNKVVVFTSTLTYLNAT